MQVTVVVPTGNECGDVIAVAPILQVTVGVGQPVAEGGVNETDAEHCPESALTV